MDFPVFVSRTHKVLDEKFTTWPLIPSLFQSDFSFCLDSIDFPFQEVNHIPQFISILAKIQISMYNVHMISIGPVKFVWDEEKNAYNRTKHGISFEEALTVFFSAPLFVFFDPNHSIEEDRYIAFGFSASSNVLAVVHCENESGKIVRIISARKATRREQKKFFGVKI